MVAFFWHFLPFGRLFPFLSCTPLQNFLQSSMITTACLIVSGPGPRDTPPKIYIKNDAI